ncbi:MAG: CPBP family intramembrane metalloprotease [Ruminiclostridium sp.]|nr:CPBP family intramembrane metalloprotease [Ruminiclostridium sp.]
MPIIIFLKAIIFGGIEEIGWRYTFQPLLEEKVNYIFSTFITFLSWGVWHFLYFYIEGSLNQVQPIPFLLGLFTNCFILSALYNKTKSLWICAMTHALINTLSQISMGGNGYVLWVCRGIIIFISIYICVKRKKNYECS